MNPRNLLIVCMLLVVVGGAFAVKAMPDPAAGMPVMRVGQKNIRLLQARTKGEIAKGLSGRDRLPEDMGMLFYFDKADIYPFWMPDMRFALDIIWIREGVVQETARLAAPVPGKPVPSYTPAMKADRVLEVDAGMAKRYGLLPGAKVVLPP